MPYSPTVWVDNVTSCGPTNFNHAETGIQSATATAEAAIPAPGSHAGSNDALVWNGSAWVSQKLTDASIAAAAAIAYSKLALTNSIVNGDISAAAAIAISKLAGYPSDATKALKGDGTWGTLSGSLLGVRIFTTSGTYTPTSGTTRVYMECLGGGGAGGGVAATSANSAAAGGGGGGAYAASILTSGFSGTSYTIGAAGSAPAAGNNPGGNGGDTSFGASVIVAKGGTGGTGGAAGIAGFGGSGGAGGVSGSSVGDVIVPGMDGLRGFFLVSNNVIGGAGGNSVLGMGAGAVSTSTGAVNSAGGAGKNYGAGGGGAFGTGTVAAAAGGAGSVGVIRIWEFA